MRVRSFEVSDQALVLWFSYDDGRTLQIIADDGGIGRRPALNHVTLSHGEMTIASCRVASTGAVEKVHATAGDTLSPLEQYINAAWTFIKTQQRANPCSVRLNAAWSDLSSIQSFLVCIPGVQLG